MPRLSESVDDHSTTRHGPGAGSSHSASSNARSESAEGVRPLVPTPYRVFFMRVIALLCACSLSIGAHFARDTLGPIKSKLGREMGTSNAQFSLLIAAFSLNSTWTPLVGGILANKFGTAFTSILATGCIFIGQSFLLLGNLMGSVRLMVFGMFIYGLGVSPLAVIQETIIVRFFRSHGLGLSMALGLVVGKFASFIAARTSYPLSEKYGAQAPMAVATLLSAFSVVMNVIYISLSRWLAEGSGVELEEGELRQSARSREAHSLSEMQALAHVLEKRRVRLHDVTKLGDVFWAYLGLNLFCGTIWAPFNHLAANMFQQRYDLPESIAGKYASYLLAGSVLLYPICGFVIDRVKVKDLALKMFVASSCLTLVSYLWLAASPTLTGTPLPAIVSYAVSLGYSPLLLAIIVPQLVPAQYVSTTLGAHKSIEKVGETIFQTSAGLILDISRKRKDPSQSSLAAIQTLLNLFVFMNVLHLISIILLMRLHSRSPRPIQALNDLQNPQVTLIRRKPTTDSDGDINETSSLMSHESTSLLENEGVSPPPITLIASIEEVAVERRGRWFFKAYAVAIGFTWVFFLCTAWVKLQSQTKK